MAEKNLTLSKEHFHFGHLGLISLCCGFIILVVLMKNGFEIKSKKSVFEKSKYTYEQVNKKITEKNNLADLKNRTAGEENINKLYNQLTLLDPTFSEGQVAGISTGTLQSLGFPSVEEIISTEDLNKIPIQLLSDTNKDLIFKYFEDMSDPELENEITLLMFDLNSEDPIVLKNVSLRIEQILTQLMQINVPKDLAEYHRLNMFYLFELGQLAEGQAGAPDVPDPKEIGVQIFSLMERLQRIKNEVVQKYSIQL